MSAITTTQTECGTVSNLCMPNALLAVLEKYRSETGGLALCQFNLVLSICTCSDKNRELYCRHTNDTAYQNGGHPSQPHHSPPPTSCGLAAIPLLCAAASAQRVS
jgi:hypothetical protein